GSTRHPPEPNPPPAKPIAGQRQSMHPPAEPFVASSAPLRGHVPVTCAFLDPSSAPEAPCMLFRVYVGVSGSQSCSWTNRRWRKATLLTREQSQRPSAFRGDISWHPALK